MNKRTVFLIGFAAVMAALYVAFFTDAWKPKNIHIMWRILPASTPPAVQFYLEKPCALTSIKVVYADEGLTNKFARPLWYLVATSSPSVISGFAYGAAVPGMKPDVPGTTAEPLQPETQYALIVESGKALAGKTTFHL